MKKRLTLKNSLAALALCLALPTFSPNMATAQEADAAAAGETTAAVSYDADPALWKISDEDTTIYLFGTVHMMKPGGTWFDEAVKTAFDESDTLILEADIPEDPAKMQQLIMPLAMAQDGKTLSSRLSEEQKANYEKAMAFVGLPAGTFEAFEPWFVTVNLGMLPAMKAGYDPNSGAEKILTAAAKERGMTMAFLETAEQQMGFFDGLSMDAQISYLDQTSRDIDGAVDGIDALVYHWGGNDPDGLGELMAAGFGGNDSEIYDAILLNRNKNWVTQLSELLEEPGTVFVAVGSGHLAGKDSVQNLLMAEGIEVTEIEYADVTTADMPKEYAEANERVQKRVADYLAEQAKGE